MKKILTLVALAALAFTSCVKEDGTYKRLQPVSPGMNIYNGTMTMQRIATQPVDMAVRLAILHAEAYKQDPDAVDPDLTKVKDGATNVFGKLFGDQVTLTKSENVYKLVFKADKVDYFYYTSQGTMTVNTGGLPLAQTSSSNPWIVSLADDYAVVLANSKGYDTLEAAASSIKIYFEAGKYKVEVQEFKANLKDAKIKSNWNTQMTFSPEKAASLAYSAIKGESFNVTATGEGPTCVTFDGESATELSLRLADGVADNYLLMRSGEAVCKLVGVGDYNTSFYKAKVAQVKWTPMPDNKLMITITYNDITENVTGFLR